MAIELESHDDTMIRQRKIGNLSNQSSSSDLLNNNNNNEKFVDAYQEERDFDAHTSTLDPTITDVLKSTAETLPYDEALNKLKEVGAKTPILPSQIGTDFNFKREIVWKNAIGFLALHICAVVGVVIGLLGYPKLYTHIYSEWFWKIYWINYFVQILPFSTIFVNTSFDTNFLFVYLLLISNDFAVWMWFRCNNGSTSTLVTSIIQSQGTIKTFPVVVAYTCRTGNKPFLIGYNI